MKTRMIYLTGPRQLEIMEEEVPVLGDDQILVKMISSGLCHSDIPMYLGVSAKGVNRQGNRTMAEKVEYPAAIGHEPVGEVLEVGRNVKKFKPGDLCGGAKTGAFGDYIVANENIMFPIPKGTRDVKHCLVEPLGCIVNIVKAAKVNFGDYVAVIGCGMMGLMTIAGLSRSGCRELVAIDLVPERLELARKYGATYTICPKTQDLDQEVYDLTKNHGMDVVVEITGSLKGLSSAAAIVRNADYFGYQGRGRILIPSLYGKPETWNPKLGYDFMFKSPEIISAHTWYSMNVEEDMEQGVWAYDKGILPLDQIITHEFALEDAHKGFECMATSDLSFLKGCVVF